MIGLIATGGTISMARRDDGSLEPAIAPTELIRRLETPVADEVEVRELTRVSGWDMTPERMVEVANVARELLRSGARGVVVTHGTDTIEETAFLCDLLVDDDGPVVLTGAMRAPDEPGADGPSNLAAALRCTASEQLRGHGSVVVMNAEIHRARFARKLDTSAVSAIESPNRGPVGEVDRDGLRLRAGRPARVAYPMPKGSLPFVPVVCGYSGSPPGLIETAARSTNAAAVVVECSGAGNLPGDLVDDVRALLADGVCVLIATRVPYGGTHATYGGPGGGATLAKEGAILAGSLPAGKGRLLASLLLALGYEGEGLLSELRKALAVVE